MVGKKLLSVEVSLNLKPLCPKQLSAVDTFSKQCVSDSATKLGLSNFLLVKYQA